MKKRIACGLLCFMMLVSLLSPCAMAADRTGGKSMLFGTEELADYMTPFTEAADQYDYIYFGNYNNKNVKWRILSKSGNGGAYLCDSSAAMTNALFLLADEHQGSAPFYKISYGSNILRNSSWSASQIKTQWCPNFENTAFNASEKEQIVRTYKSSSYPVSDALILERVFLLSKDEAKQYVIPNGGGESQHSWWLRTAGKWNYNSDADSTTNVDFLKYDGTIWSTGSDQSMPIRPGMNLNSGAIVLVSAAVGGKSNTVGELSVPSDYSGHEWKLTVQDAPHTAFKAFCSAQEGSTLTVTYQNAVCDYNSYLSAFVADCRDEGKIEYYGKLKAMTSAEDPSGTLTITLPSDFDAEYDRLYVINESCSADYKTDTSSEAKLIAAHTHTLIPTAAPSVGGIHRATYWKCSQCDACFKDEAGTQLMFDPDDWSETVKNYGTVSVDVAFDQATAACVIFAGYNDLGKVAYLEQPEQTAYSAGVTAFEFNVGKKTYSRCALMFVDPVTYTPLCPSIEMD